MCTDSPSPGGTRWSGGVDYRKALQTLDRDWGSL